MANNNTILEQTGTYCERTYAVTVNAVGNGESVAVTYVPDGFVVQKAVITGTALGSNTDVALGDSDDADRLVSSTASNSTWNASERVSGSGVGRGYQYDSETQILLSNLGSGTTTASAITAWVTIGGWQNTGGGNELDLTNSAPAS